MRDMEKLRRDGTDWWQETPVWETFKASKPLPHVALKERWRHSLAARVIALLPTATTCWKGSSEDGGPFRGCKLMARWVTGMLGMSVSNESRGFNFPTENSNRDGSDNSVAPQTITPPSAIWGMQYKLLDENMRNSRQNSHCVLYYDIRYNDEGGRKEVAHSLVADRLLSIQGYCIKGIESLNYAYHRFASLFGHPLYFFRKLTGS